VSNATHRGSYQAAQRYRRAGMGSIVLGTLALLGAAQLGYELAGLAVYVVGALLGFGLMAYVRFDDSLSLGDERLCELERRASHYTVGLVAVVGWITLVGASLLDATGYRQMTPAEGTLLMAFAAVFVTWGGFYVALRLRG